jgi:[ribosomal protein S5]-alanine N-acetyltransferase
MANSQIGDKTTLGLETPRTLLRPWSPEDWRALRPLAINPRMVRYISDGQPWSDERIQEFVSRQIACYSARGFCMWRLLLRETGAPIGLCGIQEFPENEMEIGYWLTPENWGQRLTTEAAREVLRDAFERVGLPRLVAVAQRENRASTHIMEKLGMTYERDIVHRGIPVVLYAIANPVSRHS